jgi:uncharacterized membrane protein YeaQ/YmgE (transglycosylase-associated protein family)
LGGVFICYRREDSGGYARLIYDRLASRLNPNSVFIDVHDIEPGVDFVDVLTERVGACDALVAVIGKRWLTAGDESDRRRLDDERDFVRIEIAAALERDIRLIPALVDGAVMPRVNDLPSGLEKLARRQGVEISLTRFDSDIERLIRVLVEFVDEAQQQRAADASRNEREKFAEQLSAEDTLGSSSDHTIKPAEAGPPRLITDMSLGVVGAVVGGLLASFLGIGGATGLNILSLVVAVLGAIVVLWIYHKVVGRA